MLFWFLVPAFLVVGAIPVARALTNVHREVVAARRSISSLEHDVSSLARSLRTDGAALGTRIDGLRRRR